MLLYWGSLGLLAEFAALAPLAVLIAPLRVAGALGFSPPSRGAVLAGLGWFRDSLPIWWPSLARLRGYAPPLHVLLVAVAGLVAVRCLLLVAGS